jgi:hypothetical protein
MRSSKLLATMVDLNVVFFVMLTGGFGHTSTRGVVGGAMLRRVEEGCSPSSNPTALLYDIGPLDSPVDVYVDDTFGVGRSDHVRVAWDRVVLVSERVLAPGTARKKVSLLPAWTSSEIMLIVRFLQSVPRIGRLISSSMFYSVLVVPIGNHWCYGNVSLHYLICTHM